MRLLHKAIYAFLAPPQAIKSYFTLQFYSVIRIPPSAIFARFLHPIQPRKISHRNCGNYNHTPSVLSKLRSPSPSHMNQTSSTWIFLKQYNTHTAISKLRPPSPPLRAKAYPHCSSGNAFIRLLRTAYTASFSTSNNQRILNIAIPVTHHTPSDLSQLRPPSPPHSIMQIPHRTSVNPIMRLLRSTSYCTSYKQSILKIV